MKPWSVLAYWWWVYFGLLFRSFGNSLGGRKAYRRAVSCFSRAMRHSPEEARLYYWRGTLYWRELGALERAEADLTRAIELNPKMSRAYLNRAFARTYARPPDLVGAREDLQAYLNYGRDPYWRGVAEEQLARLEQRLEVPPPPDRGPAGQHKK